MNFSAFGEPATAPQRCFASEGAGGTESHMSLDVNQRALPREWPVSGVDEYRAVTPPQSSAAERPFEADSFMVTVVFSSPNYNDRVGGPADMILLHKTGMQKKKTTHERLT